MLILGFIFLFLEVLLFGNLVRFVGFPKVLLATLVTTVIGIVVIRVQGRLAGAQMQEIARGGKDPATFVHGMLARTTGGFLLVVPGFLSDLAGISMLLPLTRPLWSRLLQRYLKSARPGGPTAGQWPSGVPGGPAAPGNGPVNRPRASEKVLDADFEVLE